MSILKIRGRTQIIPQTVDRSKLVPDFLNGSNWNITNGNNNATITGLKDPENPQDVVTKNYVDQLAAKGLRWKKPVRVISLNNIDINNPPSIIDDVQLDQGDRIAVFEQSDPKEDGIYIYQGDSQSLVRSEDMPEDYDAYGSAFIVMEGTQNGDSQWTITNDKGSAVVGTNDIQVIKISGKNTYIFQNGLTKVSTSSQNTVELGGTLIKDSTIDGEGNYSFSFQNIKTLDINTGSESTLKTLNFYSDTAIVDTQNQTPLSVISYNDTNPTKLRIVKVNGSVTAPQDLNNGGRIGEVTFEGLSGPVYGSLQVKLDDRDSNNTTGEMHLSILVNGQKRIIEKHLEDNSYLTNNYLPSQTDTYNLGSVTLRWNTLNVKTIVADKIQETLRVKQQDVFQLTETDINNGYILLTHTPITTDHILAFHGGLLMIEGSNQEFYLDPSQPNKLIFTDSKKLLLIPGDIVVVKYFYYQ